MPYYKTGLPIFLVALMEYWKYLFDCNAETSLCYGLGILKHEYKK